MIFIEKITLSSFPYLFFIIIKEKTKILTSRVYFIDATTKSEILVKKLFSMLKVKIDQLKFSYDDLFDEKGYNLGFKIQHEHLTKIPIKFPMIIFDNMNDYSKNYYIGYIKKSLMSDIWKSHDSQKSLKNILLMIQAASITSIKNTNYGKPIILIDKRPWMNIFSNYAKECGIQLFPIYHIRFYQLFYRIKYFFQLIFYKANQIINIVFKPKTKSLNIIPEINESLAIHNISPPVIVCNLHIQFFSPNVLFSNSKLNSSNFIFVSQNYTNNKISQFIVFSAKDIKSLNSPSHKNPCKFMSTLLSKIYYFTSTIENKIILDYINKFNNEKNCWINFFNVSGAKIYISHYKWSSHPLSASYAMHELGGISALWQTSYYEFPNLTASVFADLFFPFSTKIAQSEKLSGSVIKYLVSVGFIFDHRFKSFHKSSQIIRKKLLNKGSLKIISYFDGGSADDERWSVGKTYFREDYEFLLQKVLDESWLGLIIKSKKPGTLKLRLGDTSQLLDEAIQTGRCYFNDESDYIGGKKLNSRPAEAALASDLAIHQCLYAGSAGLEAALAGIPTLLFDRYGMKHSQLYKLGVGKVVFNNRNSMWDALKEHWMKGPIQGFGDWTPIIDDLDPFKDGKAVYRMTTYLHWLLEGFKQGVQRETILADAAERYANDWGEDKIVCMS